MTAIWFILITLIPLYSNVPPAEVKFFLLSHQYMAGYTMSPGGALLTGLYAFVGGLFGWLFAFNRNFCLPMYIYRAERMSAVNKPIKVFDYL